MTPPNTKTPSKYTCQLHDSVAGVNAADWDALCGDLHHPYMDRRFLRVVETTLGRPVRYWYAQLYDGTRPVACVIFSLFPSDGALFLPENVQRLFGRVRKYWASFFTFKVLLQGTPVTTGESGLAFAADVELPAALAMIDDLASQLARRHGANFISVKELDDATSAQYEFLRTRGYRKVETALTWTLKNDYESFQQYYESRTKRTRANMRKYMKRFEDSGLRYEHRSGADGVAELMTPAVHELYLNVFRKALVKFEKLPVEFFQQLAREMPDDTRWTIAYQGERVVGWVLGLRTRHMHFMLLAGVDYAVNTESDLYFNLLYRGLEYGIADRVPYVRIGATADEFKMRLGTEPKKLSFYIKGSKPHVRWILSRVFEKIFPPLPAHLVAYLERSAAEGGKDDEAAPARPAAQAGT